MPHRLHVTLALAVVLGAGSAQAQSFNCQIAIAPDETTICGDEELSRLDERLSQLFTSVRSSLSGRDRARLDSNEEAWLRRRRSCRRDAACIGTAYRQRIRELERY